jgi:hypothetical protein
LQVLHDDTAIWRLTLEKLGGLDGHLYAVSVRTRLAVDHFELRPWRVWGLPHGTIILLAFTAR